MDCSDGTVSICGWCAPLGSYHAVDANPQGFGDAVLARRCGAFLTQWTWSSLFLMVGGFLSVVMETGAINNGVAAVVRKMQGREQWMIPSLMILFGIGGTTFGMWEETMAFSVS